MAFTISCIAESEITASLLYEIAALINLVFPRIGRTVDDVACKMLRRAAGKDPFCPNPSQSALYFIRNQSGVIAHARTYPRTIRVGGGELTVLGLASVGVSPEYRGRGLGAAVVRAALEAVDRGEYPFALFQTSVADFYHKLGARTTHNRFSNSFDSENPHKNPWWDTFIMRYPASGVWPADAIDLRGPGW